ncbi:MAG: glycosyltransferase family 4 protein [Nitriliruptorales bacterium]|nr:glycosyltransferase family 4 protein [Nitriliruptorales bacterium]
MSRTALRIALTSTHAWPDVRRGGERYLHELGAALAGRGHDVTIVTTGRAPGRDRQLGVDVTRLQRRHRGQRWLGGFWAPHVWFGLDVRRHLRQDPPDVWHAFTIGDGAAATTLPGVASVYTHLGPGPIAPDVPWPIGGLHRRVSRKVDAYLCLSAAVQRRLRESTGRTSTVVGGGVDLARFRPCAPREHRPTVLFASDVNQPWKNADLLLEACALLRARLPELQLWFVGPGDVDALVDRHPTMADLVTRRSRSSAHELGADYSRAWVTAQPSTGEAFGLVALESLACGTPAVGLVGEGPADFLDASVGALAEGNPDSLADALESALNLSSKHDTVARCRGRAREHDWHTVVAPRVEEIYLRLLGDHVANGR